MASVEQKLSELKEVRKIGPTAAEKLLSAGYSVFKLSHAEPAKIAEILGSSVAVAKEIISNAREVVIGKKGELPRPMTAREYQDFLDQRIIWYTSGSKTIDRLIGGGYRSTSIVGLSGPFACHTEDTKVLTPEGVKGWREMEVGDKVFAVDENHNIVEERINNIYIYPYKGEILHFHSSHYDLSVTPNHPMLVKRKASNKYDWMKADEVRKYYALNMKTVFGWEGKGSSMFDIYEFVDEFDTEHPEKSHYKNKVGKLDTDDFVRLTGWYISEGCQFKGKRADYIQIRNKKYLGEIVELLERMGLSYSVYGTKVVVFHRYLAKYFKTRCGDGAENKRIPKEILNLSKKHLINLLDTLMKGDGCLGNNTYSTVSTALRDDFIQLVLKLGYTPKFRSRGFNRSVIDGRRIKANYERYEISFSKSKGFIQIKGREERKKSIDGREFISSGKGNLTVNKYSGIVWCFNTRGNFFTVRNGKITLSGNTGKTQGVLTALAYCIHLGKYALLLESELDTFDPQRVEEIAKERDWQYDPEKLIVVTAYQLKDVGTQFYYYEVLYDMAEENEWDVGILAIDSFNGLFQRKYKGREVSPSRKQEFARHIDFLEDFAKKFNALIMLTFQVIEVPVSPQESRGGLDSVKVRAMTGTGYLPWGGNFPLHSCGTWVSLEKTHSKEICKAHLFDSSRVKLGEAYFRISPRGLDDVPEAVLKRLKRKS